MPDDHPTPASARLAHDLREIREARGLSLDALHEETKIPMALLEQFEATGLADHPMFNRVYLRSLVRAYADLIDLPTDTALDALDEALAGTYDGSLTRLDEPEADAEPADDTEASEAAEAADEAREEPAAAPVETEPAAEDEDAVAEEQSDVPVDQAPPPRSEPPPRTEPSKRSQQTPAAASVGAGEAWDAVSPAPGARRREQPIDYEESRSYVQWVVVGVAVLALVGIIYLLVSWLGGSDDATVAQRTPPTPADTTAAPDTTAQEPQREPAAIGDTINVVVVAAEGPVQGLRITRDDDLRRPYWIEEGEAKAFPALDRIVLEDALDPIRLLVEGYEFPNTRRDDQGRIVLTREAAQAFLDSVSVEGPPVDLSAPLERVRQGPIQSQ